MKKLFAFLLILTVMAQADTKRFQNQITIQDTQLRPAAANNNYGQSTAITYDSASTGYVSLIGFLYLQDSIGAGKTMQTSVCSIYASIAAGTDTGQCYLFLKPMFEGDKSNATGDTFDVTWNDWFAADSEWNTAGLGVRSNDSTFNAWDDAGGDMKATAFDTLITTDSGWVRIDIPANIMQNFYDSNRNGGIAIFGRRTSLVTWRTSENTIAAHRPILFVNYTTASSEQPSSRRRKLLLE